MAKIEDEFLAARKDGDQYPTPSFLPRKPIPDLGHEPIDGERFYSREFMEREWKHIWTRVWNIGVRESDLPDPGSYQTYELGNESFLFVRGDDGKIRGFYNICQHRGNILCQGASGDAKFFKCPFHGWEWNTDGTLRRVMDPQFFRQFDCGIPEGKLDLVPVQVDSWGGWIWFNMDMTAPPLRQYLGEAGQHLESYKLEEYSLIDYKTFEWKGNWKHAHDAFNESYHFEALHPDFIHFAEGHDIPIELLGIHSRMLNFNVTVSEVVEDRESITPLRAKMMSLAGVDPETYRGPAKDVHLEVLRRKRAIQDKTHHPYRQMNDEQLVHQYHYTFFPNATFTQTPEASFVFRYRPHPEDPNFSYFDFFILVRQEPGVEPPEYEHKVYKHDELPLYKDAFAGTLDPILANILQQDGTNMPTMQRGMKSAGFKGMILSEQEIRLRHFHQTIDRFLKGDIPPELRRED